MRILFRNFGLALLAIFLIAQTNQKINDPSEFVQNFVQKYGNFEDDSILIEWVNNIDTVGWQKQDRARYLFIRSGYFYQPSRQQQEHLLTLWNNENLGTRDRVYVGAGLGAHYLRDWDFTSSKEYVDRAYKLFKNNQELFTEFEKKEIKVQLAFVFYAREEYEKAFELCKAFIENAQDEPNTQFTFNQLNATLLTTVGTQNALAISKIQDIIEQKTNEFSKFNPRRLLVLYNNLGQANIQVGNYTDALDCQLKAKSISDSVLNGWRPYEWAWHMSWLNGILGNFQIAEQYINESRDSIYVWNSDQSYDRFLINLQDLENRLLEKNIPKAKNLLYILDSLDRKFNYFGDEKNNALIKYRGLFFFYNNNYIKALELYQELIETYQKEKEPRLDLVSFYSKKVECLLNLGEKEAAKKAYEEHKKSIDQLFKNNKSKYIQEFLSLGINFIDTKDFQSRLNLYQSILDSGEESFYYWNSKAHLGLAKAYLEIYHQAAKAEKLQLALDHIIKAYKLHEIHGNYIKAVEDKERYKNASAEIYRYGVSISFEAHKNDLPQASDCLLMFMDQPKFQWLRNNLQSEWVVKGNPELQKLNDQKRQLEARISSIQKNLSNLEGDEQKWTIRGLDSMKIELNTLDSRLRNQSNKLELWSNLEQLTVTKLKSLLNRNEVFITYSPSQNSNEIIGLCIGKNSIKVVSIDGINVQDRINKTYQALSVNNIGQFKLEANTLYQKLLQPFDKQTNNKNIILAPAEAMFGLNFELLVKNLEGESFRDLDYTLEEHEIKYWFSAHTQWMFQKIKEKNVNNDWAAFVPREYQSDSLPSQPFIHKLARELKEKKKWNLYDNQNASRTSFLNNYHRFNKLFLGVHTSISHESPLESGIIFYGNERLNISEILGQNFNQDLVLLAGCDGSMAGSSKHGLGAFSIANSFAFSGTKGVILSHWEIDEKATSELLRYFYEHLEDGLAASKALHMAKLDFIKNAQDPKLANPYYWGGLVLMGYDSKPIGYSYWWWLLLLPILVLVYFLIYNSKKQSV